MARVGSNPMRIMTSVHQHSKITVSIVVNIPSLDGYWKQSLDVLRLCLNSLRNSTVKSFDLMVFDNDSCMPVQSFLDEELRQGMIQFLIHSKDNIGKLGAWNFMFLAAPGDIIGYADSDVLFFPGWLEASLEILEAFPKTGMVTAQPSRMRASSRDINSTALNEAPKCEGIVIERGSFVLKKYLNAHRIGLGISEEVYRKKYLEGQDIRLRRNGTSAYISSSHFQFLTTKEVLQKIFPIKQTTFIEDEIEFDVAVNKLGYWRLSTIDYFAHHMGNTTPSINNDYDGLVEIV